MPYAPAVINFSVINAERAAKLLRSLYPQARITCDPASNAIVVVASADDVNGMRTVASGIDIKGPRATTIDTVQLHNAATRDALERLPRLFPSAHFLSAPNQTIVVSASATDIPQIKAVVAAMDAPVASATPKPVYPSQVLHVTQTGAKRIATALSHMVANLHVATSGEDIIVSGTADDIAQAKEIVADLDHPDEGTSFSELYRFHNVDASSVASLFGRSFHDIGIQVDRELNAVTISAPAAIQQRIADAVSQLDAAPAPGGGSGSGPQNNGAAVSTEVVMLKAAVPSLAGAASTSAADIAQSVTQALAGVTTDLKITVHPNSTRLILTGSAYSRSLAKELIGKLDTAEPLVELDTEVYEVDEGVQKQLGLKFPTAALSSTYSEQQVTTTDGSTPPRLRLQPLVRTPLSLQAQLDLLVSTNHARILEDPRLTTFSGRTASLRAGETVNVLTTTGGGSGTVATTQIQSFQTGVTLDITPVVNADDYVTVTLHPSVNTEAGISAAGVPNIQTRDTTTTVGLHDGETIVVGGLIEDSNSRLVQKIPVLGDLPVIGRLFQDVGVNHTRNELVVTVTPHILKAGRTSAQYATDLPAVPVAAALPQLPPETTLPPRRRSASVATVSASPNHTDVTATAVPTSKGASASPTPLPLPSAFGLTNVYTFGSPPPNNYAEPTQVPRIFYAQVQPTVITAGQPITISAITTTNVSALSLGTSPGTPVASVVSIGPGKWQATFTMSSESLPASHGNVSMLLTATTGNGATISLPISLSLPSQ